MFYLQIFVASFLSTLVITPFVIRQFISSGIVDKPAKRRINTSIIPRMGGAIVYIVSIVMFISFYSNIEGARIFIIASIAIAMCGNLDDMFSLRWNQKFIIQTIAAVLIAIELFLKIESFRVFGVIIPLIPAFVIVGFFIVGLLNSINFMDGLDGLVSGYSIVTFLVLLYIGYIIHDQFVIILSIAIIGSLIGFLKFNTYPAKIFLGDTGSLALAFFMVYLSLKVSVVPTIKPYLDFTFPLLLFALPLVDSLKVIFLRLWNKKSPFEADNNHLHHLILGLEIRQKITTFIIHLFSITVSILAILYYESKNTKILYFSVIVVLALIALPNILGFLKDNLLRSVYHGLKSVPEFLIKSFKVIHPTVSLIIFLLFFVPIIKNGALFNNTEIYYFIGLTLVLFFVALYMYYKGDPINHVYVFFNFIILLFLFNFPNLKGEISLNSFWLHPKNQIYSGILLTFVLLVFFVYIRDGMSLEHKSIYVGQDLVLIVLLILTFIVGNIFETNLIISSVAAYLLIAFSLYSLYLVALKIFSFSEKYMFFGSFFIPLIASIILLLTN